MLIEKSGFEFSSLPEVIKSISKSLPIVLHLHGKGILNKTVKNKPNYRQSALLNSNEEDFYFYEYSTKENVFISVIRKEVLNDKIIELKNHHFYVVESFFGPFLLESNDLLPNQPTSIQFDKIQLDFKNKILVKSSKPSEDSTALSLSGKQLEKAYAEMAAKNYYDKLKSGNLNTNLFHKDQKLKILFNRLAIFVLSFFLILLSSNYVWLNELNKEVADKNSKLAEHQEALDQINQLKEEKKRKLKLLNTSGILNSNFISFYLDEIAASIPTSISLSSMDVYPIRNNIKANKQIKIDDHFIIIEGKTERSQPFNEWIQDLTTNSWIEKIEIQNYIKKKRGQYEFEIKMQLK